MSPLPLKCFGLISFFVLFFPFFVSAQSLTNSHTDVSSGLEDFAKLSKENKNLLLSSAGLDAADFNLGKMLAYFLFSSIGFVAFSYGKKQSNPKPLVVGLILMIYPYFISNLWAIYGVGFLLCAGLYFFRDY